MTEPQIFIADWQRDNAALTHIRRRVFIDEQFVPEALEWDEHDAKASHFLAIFDNSAVATARLKTDGQIGRMAVLKQYRSTGIGSQLLSFVLVTARQKGFKAVYLYAQIQVIDFYRKFGFVEQGEDFDDAGIMHREMRLSLM